MKGIQISQQSSQPIYEQLFEQSCSLIFSGSLESGFNLPPIRTAAKELGISIITVKKAWEELERAGLIYRVTGKGCFVATLTEEDIKKKRWEMAKKQMNHDLKYYKKMGLTLAETKKLMEECYRSL